MNRYKIIVKDKPREALVRLVAACSALLDPSRECHPIERIKGNDRTTPHRERDDVVAAVQFAREVLQEEDAL